ncbi:hypothetical protein [Haloarcula pelagica]|nr:hypothetical protein [Halomicroarcula sp. YJ-61-S]
MTKPDDVIHERTDRDVTDLSKAALVAEWSEICENLRHMHHGEDGHATAVDRRHELWTEMRARTDADPPECPECDGTRWTQAIGGPKHCTQCGLGLSEQHQETIEAVDDYWESVQSVPEDQRLVTDGGPEVVGHDRFQLCERCGDPVDTEQPGVWKATNDEQWWHEDCYDEDERLITDGGVPDPDQFRIPTIAELDAMRADAGLSMRDLSRCAGYKDNRFSHILNTDTNPHCRTVRAFLTVLREFDGETDSGDQGPDPEPSAQAADDGEGPTEVDVERIAAKLRHLEADDVGEDPSPDVMTDGGVDYDRFDHFYMQRGNTSTSTFHASPACSAIKGKYEDRTEDRGPEYARFCDARPCPRCHGDDEYVFVSAGKNHKHRFHRDPECGHLQRAAEITRKRLDDIAVHFEPCRRCAGGTGHNQRGEMDEQPCPLCGEPVKELPAHLPCDGDGEEVATDGGDVWYCGDCLAEYESDDAARRCCTESAIDNQPTGATDEAVRDAVGEVTD